MTKMSGILERCKSILVSKTLDRPKSLEICSAVNFYFANGRPREFRSIEPKIRSRFSEIIKNLTVEEGLVYTDNFFLFCYTFADDARNCQNEIHDDICLTYLDWLENQKISIEFSKVQPEKKHILFICRHATTAGGYAPGMSVYTFSKALSMAGYKVFIFVLGSVDTRFRLYAQTNENLELFQVKEKQITERLHSAVSAIQKVKPCVVLTEIEFGIPAFLSIQNLPTPIIYLSAGYYNLPWYDRIGLTDTLSKNPVPTHKDKFFEIPTYVDMELLSPSVDVNQVNALRQKLGYTKLDFVIGAFARMEKFSPQFLDMICKIMSQNQRIKTLLAGPNNTDRVSHHLRHFVDEGRCHILGQSNVHILGHILNFGIDTFPNHSGFTLNELMAKGVPVVTKWTETIDANWEMRIPELIFKTEDDLSTFLNQIIEQPRSYGRLCAESKNFMMSKERHDDFAKIMSKEIGALSG